MCAVSLWYRAGRRAELKAVPTHNPGRGGFSFWWLAAAFVVAAMMMITAVCADTPLTTFAASAESTGIVGSSASALVPSLALTTQLSVVYTSPAENTTVDGTACAGVRTAAACARAGTWHCATGPCCLRVTIIRLHWCSLAVFGVWVPVRELPPNVVLLRAVPKEKYAALQSPLAAAALTGTSPFRLCWCPVDNRCLQRQRLHRCQLRSRWMAPKRRRKKRR